MSRDMKPRKAPPGRKSGGGTLLGLFIGLVIGVIAVAGVVWYINKAPLPFTTTGQQPRLPPPVAGKATPASRFRSAAGCHGTGGPAGQARRPDRRRKAALRLLQDSARQGGGDSRIPSRRRSSPRSANLSRRDTTRRSRRRRSPPRPGRSRDPGQRPANRPRASRPRASRRRAKSAEGAKGSKEATLKEPIYLQAGSFQSASEADNQKAKLALLGAEARIQQVMLQDKVWYRVRLGPYHKIDDVNHLRADLARQGIDANLVRKD
jgi:cell division protein FtsN